MNTIPFRTVVCRAAAAAALVALLGAPSLAWSGDDAKGGHHGGHQGGHPGGHHGGKGPGMFRMERMMEELDLSETQRAEVERIHEQGRSAMKAHGKSFRAGRRAMRELIEADSFDEAAVRALAESQSAARVEMAVQHARDRHAIWKLLTPAQREQMAQKMAKHHKHHEGED